MKFLQMYGTINACNGGELVVGMKPIVDISDIHQYVVKNGVCDTQHKYVGDAIKCFTENNVFFASPPINRTGLYYGFREVESKIARFELEEDTDEDKKSELDAELDVKQTEYVRITESMNEFIPFMIRAFKESEDGTILRIVVKDNEWALEEV